MTLQHAYGTAGTWVQDGSVAWQYATAERRSMCGILHFHIMRKPMHGIDIRGG